MWVLLVMQYTSRPYLVPYLILVSISLVTQSAALNCSFMQLIHILPRLQQKPKRKKIQGLGLENKEARELGLLFLTNDQKTPHPERDIRGGRYDVLLHLTGRLFLEKCDTRQCLS
ncbi:hypothetical protein L798_00470 [Zootermopsis nevadensis]|uniref:Uncharacterized protein n=1 Tax=Zootermopsis nevadensis TaxID=136037 RepID=A0A067RQ96_ZOONE|nr:hypothetical protein L798_00470 [Zootermopsis nevadensis]